MEDREFFDEGENSLMIGRVASLRIRDGYLVATPETPPLRKDLAVPETGPGLEPAVLRRRTFEEELG